LRSVEDLQSHQTSLSNELDDLNAQFEGLPFPDDEGELFAAKTEEHAEAGKRIAELNGRKAVLERLRGKDENSERTWEAPQVLVRDKVDPYDFNESRFRSLEERNQAWRDEGMRITEVTTFPHPDTDVDATR